MKKVETVGLLMTLGLFCLPPAFADPSISDILNDLHQSDQMEVRMGQLAQDKGATDDMKSFGKTLVDDHGANDIKVKDFATKKGITLKNAEPGMMEKMETKHFKELSGSDFDHKFAKAMVDDHKKDISKLQKAQKSELPADIREFVGDTLPTLQKHLEMAEKMAG